MAWCKENHQAIAFELKSRALDMYDFMPEIARQMVEVLRKYDFFDMCFVFSTDFRTLAHDQGHGAPHSHRPDRALYPG